MSVTGTLILTFQAKLQPNSVEPPTGLYSKGVFLALPSNIRLWWKWLRATNNLADYVILHECIEVKVSKKSLKFFACPYIDGRACVCLCVCSCVHPSEKVELLLMEWRDLDEIFWTSLTMYN